MNLITGTTGLVGAHLALLLLEKGQSVRGIFRSEAKKERTKNLFKLYGKENLFSKIDWVKADICDVPALEKAFPGIAQVYHCAALISFDPKDEEAMRKINIEGTANVVNLSLDFGVEKLCYISSVAALGDLKEHETITDEETEWNPEKHHSDYAISKYGAEMEIWRGQTEGLNSVAVVPGIILGPGFWDEGSGKAFSTIEKGFPFYTLGATGFVAVTDVVRMCYELMKSDMVNERFIAIGGHCNFKEVSFAIADGLGAKRPHIQANRSLLKTALFVDWLLSLIGKKRTLFEETVDALLRHRRFSTNKVQSDLGFEFTEIIGYISETIRIEKGKST